MWVRLLIVFLWPVCLLAGFASAEAGSGAPAPGDTRALRCELAAAGDAACRVAGGCPAVEDTRVQAAAEGSADLPELFVSQIRTRAGTRVRLGYGPDALAAWCAPPPELPQRPPPAAADST